MKTLEDCIAELNLSVYTLDCHPEAELYRTEIDRLIKLSKTLQRKHRKEHLKNTIDNMQKELAELEG